MIKIEIDTGADEGSDMVALRAIQPIVEQITLELEKLGIRAEVKSEVVDGFFS